MKQKETNNSYPFEVIQKQVDSILKPMKIAEVEDPMIEELIAKEMIDKYGIEIAQNIMLCLEVELGKRIGAKLKDEEPRCASCENLVKGDEDVASCSNCGK